MRGTQRAIASLLMTFFVGMILLMVLGGIADSGALIGIWADLVEKIPFGGDLAKICVMIYENITGFHGDLNKYVVGKQTVDIIELLKDFSLVMLTAMTFQAISGALQAMMGVAKKQGGLHNKIMQMCCDMVGVLAGTILATLVLDFFYQQLGRLPSIAQFLFSFGVYIVSIGGAAWVVGLVLGYGILKSLLKVIVEVAFVNVFRVFFTYVEMLLLVMFLNEKAYLKVAASLSGWAVIMVLIFVVKLLVSDVLEMDF